MKNKLYFIFIIFFPAYFSMQKITAQQYVYKEPILKIDFGNQENSSPVDVGYLRNYRQQRGTCPDDGNYSFASHTSDCFNGDWITMEEDHTAGDNNGVMMIINAAITPATFFLCPVNNLKAGTKYEFSSWIVNVCKTTSPCNPTPPYLSFTILGSSGNQLVKFRSGRISPTNGANWHRYYGEFTTPPGTTDITIKMDDETNGGCGNDFAIDDITLREMELVHPEPEKKEIPKPAIKPEVKKPVTENKPVEKKPVIVKKEAPANLPSLKKNAPVITKEEVKLKPATVKPTIKERTEKIPVPEVLTSRSNPVVKEIETSETEMLIELYDNGEIDGDTVSIYHNNELVVSRAGLSEKAVSIKIKVDKQQPHHELVMVANNLGSIPPNTSLMIITANEKRYEVFISSSKQKNAKVLINLKE